MNNLSIDAKFVSEILQKFLKEETTKTGFKKVILGLSGGVDSTVVAYLCALAFEPKNVTAEVSPAPTLVVNFLML